MELISALQSLLSNYADKQEDKPKDQKRQEDGKPISRAARRRHRQAHAGADGFFGEVTKVMRKRDGVVCAAKKQTANANFEMAKKELLTM